MFRVNFSIYNEVRSGEHTVTVGKATVLLSALWHSGKPQ
jgi:hypothetical protein